MRKKILILFFCVFLCKNIESKVLKPFAGYSISKELFLFIRKTLPKGSTILELGSGWTSGEFSKYYTVYSVEHDSRWINKYNTHYIYAPIVNGWYDTNALKKNLPKAYNLILVDGPPQIIGREKFFENLNLFNTDVIIIFDDVNRKTEHQLMVSVAQKLNRSYKVFSDSRGTKFGVLL